MLRFFDRLNLTPAERRLVVIIFAVTFVVVNYWLVWPRFGDFKTLSDDITSMIRKQEIFSREISRKPMYEMTLRKLQAEGSILPAGEERIQFRSDMERLAREVGLTVPSWSEVLPERSSGSTTNAFFEAISLTMRQVSGSEAQFVDFLFRVGSSNSTIRVKELSLAPGNFDQRSQGRTNLIAASIKLVASVQKSGPQPSVNPTGPAAAAKDAPRPVVTPATNKNPVASMPGPVLSRSNALAPSQVLHAARSNAPPLNVARTNSFPIPVRVLSRTNKPAAAPAPGS